MLSPDVREPLPAPEPASALQAQLEPPAPAREAWSAAERRQLTVLFCDLVGLDSARRSTRSEDFREVMVTYQTTCAEVVQRYGGHIAQYLGDGLLVYFAIPRPMKTMPNAPSTPDWRC